MYLHEYQAKQLLSRFGVNVMPFQVVSSLEEVEAILKSGLKTAIVKIQVHAGGRGKAGGVKVAKNPDEIRQAAKALLGMRLVNNQTGSEGIVSEKILLDTPAVINNEYYLAVILDRKKACASVIASPEGGMEIEEVAAKSPEKIFVERVPESGSLRLYQLNRLAKNLGWTGDLKVSGIQCVEGCVKAFFALDATLVEINPLVATDSEIVALDAKISVDDNALFRHKALQEMYDPSQVSVGEKKAHEHDLAYVALDGNIGCMVNGAGLAMATMDLIRFWGGNPANFLDVGGGASEDKVIEGFRILFSDPKVKVILVNIFGGIMNCETIARGLIHALKELGEKVPVVVRMEGTNVVSARKLLGSTSLKITTTSSLDEAAKAACQIAKGA